METFVKQRPVGRDRRARRRTTGTARVDVDDAVTMIGRFRNGAIASLEATRFAAGRKNSLTLEINGSAGSIFFDLEEMNRLKFFSRRDPQDRQGFRDILVTEPAHPYIDKWWPPGHIIGYEHTFIHTIADFVKAVVARKMCNRILRIVCERNACSRRLREAMASQRLRALLLHEFKSCAQNALCVAYRWRRYRNSQSKLSCGCFTTNKQPPWRRLRANLIPGENVRYLA